jgi:carbon storage regulator
MLVLTRRVGERIVISDDIQITVLAITGGRVRLGIAAPESIPVNRHQVHERHAQQPSLWLPNSVYRLFCKLPRTCSFQQAASNLLFPYPFTGRG